MFSQYDRYTSPSTITFNRALSKYYVTFAGTTIETTVTDKAATAFAWVHDIVSLHGTRSTVVGLDVKWRPHPVPSMSNKSATLQLCVDNKCLIIQLFYMDEIPDSIKGFLMNPNFTFVGIEVEGDVLKLKNEYGLDCSSHVDVRAASVDYWSGKYRKPGLKDLARELCGLYMKKPIHKPKHVCMSNWEARLLNEAQVEYACIDAFASYKIGHKLLIEN
ncbi:werner syndrome-like exonuclease [Phtheirospermum japonicum]|uniref:Werner syndrome-like exonuclease n=1 Tax=Phtheirospermum japonicum TaxID=374723 RepID=A0A830BJZ9_9LAMI|nr:werner syndrome-like exonuclease [Phtheirospermum japonicum]